MRFASEKYDTKDLKNVFSHLTNYSINKKYKTAAQYKEAMLNNSGMKQSTSLYTQKYQNTSLQNTTGSKQSSRIKDDNGPRNPFVRPGSQLDAHAEFESRNHVTKSKWTLRAFKEYLKNLRQYADPKEALGLNIDILFKKINDIVVKTIISAEPLLWNGVEMYLPNTYQFDTSS